MREISFRGKRVSDGEWVLGVLVIRSDGLVSIVGYCGDNPVHAETVGQYIGLKDKYGIGIYEGDIVVAFKGEDCEGVYAVCYDADHCEWFLSNPYNKLSMELEEFYWLDLEIIGNIHDNPELLEVE